MKKFLAIFLICATLFSMLVLPISATETSVDRVVVNNCNAYPVTMDGVKNDNEGWGDTPAAYLNKNYDISDGTENTASRGEVYVAADTSYVYVFFKLYSDYNAVFDSSTTQTFVKVYFGKSGEEEISFWGRNTGVTSGNVSKKSWTTGEAETYKGFAKNNNADGSWTVECRLPIPSAVKTAMNYTSQELKISVCQGLGTGGGYISDTVTAGATEKTTARNAKDYGITLTLQKLPDTLVTDATVKYVNKGNITVDGIRAADEQWATVPYLTLYKQGFYGTMPEADSTPTRVYLSTDGEYLYFLIESDNHKDGDHRQRIAVNFGSGNGNFTANYYVNRTRTHSAPTLNDYSGSDASSFTSLWSGATVYTEATNTTVTEFAVPFTATVKSALLKGKLDIKIGMLEHPMSGDGGYMTSEGYEWTNTAQTKVTLPVIPVAANESRVIGVQSRVNPDDAEKRDVRFVAVIDDYKAYEELGFSFTWGEKVGRVNCYTVYSELLADGQTVKPETYGGKYFFAYTLEGLEKGEEYTFTAQSFTKKTDADAVLGVKASVTVTVGADGSVSFQ